MLEVKGNPTPEELAAALAVLAGGGGSPEAAEPAPPSRWNDRAALLRRPLSHGPGAWRAAR
ncbi:MAG TPA: acyl-CoA carboxylase subunit epsilon [Mycobacteriales bacterium]|nr:acyl-CoA carboxylase subunit epsilon [Mycobacteriales bacterium]